MNCDGQPTPGKVRCKREDCYWPGCQRMDVKALSAEFNLLLRDKEPCGEYRERVSNYGQH